MIRSEPFFSLDEYISLIVALSRQVQYCETQVKEQELLLPRKDYFGQPLRVDDAKRELQRYKDLLEKVKAQAIAEAN